MATKLQAHRRALELAGVPDYSEVISSSSSSATSEESDKLVAPKKASCHFCGHGGLGLQQCGSCQKGVYCSSLCLAEHHLPFCSRKR